MINKRWKHDTETVYGNCKQFRSNGTMYKVVIYWA